MIRAAIGLCVLLLLCATAGAAPRHHHHHHWTRAHASRFVWADPRGPAEPYGAAFVGGYVETGLLPSFTADPYRAPAIGYRVDGSFGPGFAYP